MHASFDGVRSRFRKPFSKNTLKLARQYTDFTVQVKIQSVTQEDNWRCVSTDRTEPYDVGERVEVLCDHNQHGERVHDWLEGVVVQVDAKMLAVQFQENVY
jgi:hypothetical protein